MFSTGAEAFSSDWIAVLLACALLLAPVLAGLLTAAALRAVVSIRRRAPWTAALVIVPVALSLAAITRTDNFSFWDFLFVGLGFAAGAVVAMGRPDGRVLTRSLQTSGRLGVGLLIAELLARLVLPSPGSVPPPRAARLVMPVNNRDPSCSLIFPTANAMQRHLRAGGRARPAVLHIGDSLVAGVGVPQSLSFVSALGDAQPDIQHVNLGAAGAGPDVYLLALRRWGGVVRPRMTVVYLFAGNDMADLNAHYLCCPAGGLLVDQGGRSSPRCASPEWRIPVRMHLASSPPPFVLRALAQPSRIAGHLLRAVIRLQQDALRLGLGNIPSGCEPASRFPRWSILDQRVHEIAAAARELNSRLLVVVIPSRTTLEKTLGLPALANDYWVEGPRGVEGHRRIVETVRAAGIDVLDGWDVVRAAIQQEGVERVFAHEYPGDVHFGRVGHQRFAAWLLEALRARGVTP